MLKSTYIRSRSIENWGFIIQEGGAFVMVSNRISGKKSIKLYCAHPISG